MNLNFLLKALFISLFTSFVLAEEVKRNCKNIRSYIESKKFDIIYKCVENDKGEVIEITINRNKSIPESVIKEVLSYPTITKLTYIITLKDFDGYFYDYGESEIHVENLSEIMDLSSNLKELRIDFNCHELISHTSSTHYDMEIKKDTLKKFKNLKKLTLENVTITDYIVDEIASLSCLNELVIINCGHTNSLKLTPLNNNKELKNLTLKTYNNYEGAASIDLKDIGLGSLNNIKNLTLDYILINKENINEIVKMENLEELYMFSTYEVDKIKYSFNKLKKLTSFTLYLASFKGYYEDEDENHQKYVFELPTSVKKLTLGDDFQITQDNIDTFASLPNLEELKLNGNKEDGIKINYKSLSNSKKLKKIEIITKNITQDNINEIGKLSNLEEIYLSWKIVKNLDLETFKNLNNLKSLNVINTEFEFEYSYLEYEAKHSVKFKNTNTNKLNKLKLEGVKLSSSDINEILNMSNLEDLSLKGTISKDVNINKLESLKKLSSLALGLTNENIKKITEFPKFIFNLSNLKKLECHYLDVSTIPEELTNLKNLEYLDLSKNNFDSLLSSSFNNLNNLKFINLMENKNIKGKVLTNKNLEYCFYESNYNLCKPKDVPSCLGISDFNYEYPDDTNSDECQGDCYKFKYCNDSEDYNDPNKDYNDISKDGKCGENYRRAKCPAGQCCSKYGNCGKSDDHCSIEKGCQSEFGQCGSSTDTEKKISENGKCGEKNGNTICPSGQCCSKYGHCGKTDDHCSVEKGCQSEFGQCGNSDTSKKISENGKCGEKNGNTICPSGKCCSKYGWCGKTTDYCSISKGCQSRFGECSNSSDIEKKISENGKCGEKNDNTKCPSGQCCSKYGHCGKTDDYCSIEKGCQSEFGKCGSSTDTEKKISENGKCGKDNGSTKCPSGQCCSKYGHCGKTDEHCSIEKGCQSEFGQCNSGKNKEKDKISENGKCGKDNGNTKCPSGQCCSKFGWCGKTNDYCSIEKGCQSGFGQCNSKKTNYKISKNGKCGQDNDNTKCPSGQCCSVYGYCGKSDKYCGKGCQSEFGECH